MTETDDIRIIAGFPADQRTKAAELFWAAFSAKLGTLLGPKPKAIAFLTRVIDPNFAMSACAPDGTLLGLAGFKTTQGALVGGDVSDLAAIYGWPGTLWRAPLLSVLERDMAKNELLMDGIMVDAQARGRGIGTKLLNAIKAEAERRGCSSVRLDVIDSNPRARALYERQGFVAGETSRLGPFRHLFGFRASTTMRFTCAA